ncbi:hypothetical protein D3C85_844860 [compost metagenome]
MGPTGFDAGGHHHRIAEKQRGLDIVGITVKVQRMPRLHQSTVAHHRQLIGEGQRFALIMGDQDGGDPRFRQQTRDQFAHARAQAGIERGERFIQQHQPWLLGQGSCQRHPLLLTAGQFVWPAFGHVRIQRHAVHQFLDTLLFFVALGRQAEADVGGHRHVREQRAVLRHITNQALMRRHFMGAVNQRLAVE